MGDRSAIEAELRRRVLVEAGHRCAIPTCRYIETDIHHIVPWATCQKHEYENLIALCPNCHRRADAGEIDRKSLYLYKLNLRFVHDKFSQLEMDILFELYAAGPTGSIAWHPMVLILLKRIQDSDFVEVHASEDVTSYALGVRTDPHWLTLTGKGRAFLDELSIKEIGIPGGFD